MSAPPPPKLSLEEEDLDDLDDVLDEFDKVPPAPKPPTSAPKSTAPTSAPPSSAAIPPPNSSLPDDDDTNEDDLNSDFARELQKGMESLMREMGGLGGGAGGMGLGGLDGSVLEGLGGGLDAVPGAQDPEQEKVFKAAWEAMLAEGMDGMVGDEFKPGSSGAAPAVPNVPKPATGKVKEKAPAGADGKKQDFQAGIRAAVDKMKSSESGFKEGNSAPSASSDPFEALLSQLNAAGLGDLTSEALQGEGGGENEEELQGMLEMMMGSLMSKDVLYEPLKELGEKFPEYIKENEAKLSPEDKTRYRSQVDIITKIVKAFEDPSYSEDDKAKSAEIVELMGEMQSYGSPPTEIMGDLPPGLNLGGDGMPQMPEGCCIA